MYEISQQMCHIQCIPHYFTSWIYFYILMPFSYTQNKIQLQQFYIFLNFYPFKILQVFCDTKFVYFYQITKNSFLQHNSLKQLFNKKKNIYWIHRLSNNIKQKTGNKINLSFKLTLFSISDFFFLQVIQDIFLVTSL